MRTALCLALGVAVALSAVPAFAQHPRVPDHGKCAGTGITVEAPQTLGSNTGISVVEPIGSIRVDPESLDGEPVYVRRTTVTSGVAMVEVSTTPFISNEESSGVPGVLGRPDQPAGW